MQPGVLKTEMLWGVRHAYEEVTLRVPARILADLRALVDAGVYLAIEEALREFVLASWRHVRGSYHTIRVLPETGDDADATEPGSPPDEANLPLGRRTVSQGLLP
jgi:hypothetical protein